MSRNIGNVFSRSLYAWLASIAIASRPTLYQEHDAVGIGALGAGEGG